MSDYYEVLTPWAEIDAKNIRGLSPRHGDLAGRRIGLFASTFKRAALPIQRVVERRLRERFTTAQFSYFEFPQNRPVLESERRTAFEEWVRRQDAVVAAVGD